MRKPSLLVLAAAAILVLSSQAATAAKRPNILFVFADDLGWKDVGYQESSFCETPNIDRLAREGMVFSDGYAAAGNCAAQSCLLAVRYLHASAPRVCGGQHAPRSADLDADGSHSQQERPGSGECHDGRRAESRRLCNGYLRQVALERERWCGTR